VRYLLVKGHQKFTMEQLHAGNYEIRHQAIGSANCSAAANPAAGASATSAVPTAPES
jgi:hypothetical protein